MTALSPDALALLRLMAEVGAPLRKGRYGFLFFPGRQNIKVLDSATLGWPGRASELSNLILYKLVAKQQTMNAPPWATDYVLTDKGREPAGSGD